MKLSYHPFGIVTFIVIAAITTTEAASIRNKIIKTINGTAQTILDVVMNITFPVTEEPTSTSRRVWITYERGKQVNVLDSMDANRMFSTNMIPLYDFPGINSIVTMATDEEIAALMANSTIGPVNVTEDPKRYPMLHSTRNVRTNGQRYMQSSQTTPYGIPLTQVDQVWSTTGLTGAGVTVCVIDTGFDISNPDFVTTGFSGTSLITGNTWDTDSSGHGTHVSGIVAAANNGIGVVGAAPGATIYMIDVFGDNGFAYVSALVDAAYKCRDVGAKIISMSLGGPQYSDQENSVFTELYNFNGILSVAAAGNDGNSGYGFPASYDNVLSVGAVDESKTLAFFSNFNDRVDLVAPGVDVLSTLPSNNCEICLETGQFTYGIVSGTSQATPYVSGIAALLWSYNTDLGVEMIYNALLNSAEDLGDIGRDNNYGNGLVSALAAYNSLTSSSIPAPPINTPITPPVQAPVSDPTAGTSCVEATLNFRTDLFPLETFVKLTDLYSGVVLWYGGASEPFTDYILTSECLNPNSCYGFEFFDTYGDGICCSNGDGYFQLTYNGIPVASGTSFGLYFSYFLGDGCQI
jgi:Subtilase family